MRKFVDKNLHKNHKQILFFARVVLHNFNVFQRGKTLDLTLLSDQKIVSDLEALVDVERQTTAEILEYIKEVDSRRLYLKLGHTSLFAYLTRGLGYTPASAQRRIEAARMLGTLPEVAEQVAEGSLNLMQLSMMAQGLREKNAANEGPAARLDRVSQLKLLDKIRGQDIEHTQVILARELEIEPKMAEKRRLQRNESLRLELTLSKEQREVIERAKELMSHVHHNPSWAELFVLLAQDSIQHRDPLAKKAKVNKCRARATSLVAPQRQNSKPDVTAAQAPIRSQSPMPVQTKHSPPRRRAVPAAVKRVVFQRDKCCQWRNSSGEICGSRYQLQLDHVHPVYAGGANTPENLQLLCSAHNRHKYQKEISKFTPRARVDLTDWHGI